MKQDLNSMTKDELISELNSERKIYQIMDDARNSERKVCGWIMFILFIINFAH